ncbi:MAG: ferredoxin-thioredoxin reductase catalytic domain-containing protein [Candidatus Nanoarchaeia archaeon]
MVSEKELLRQRLEAYAKREGISFNPNKEAVEHLLDALVKKDGYCPCRRELIPENKCPCVFSKAEIKKDGHCLCMLFFK